MIGGYILAEVTKADKLAVKALMDCAEAVKQDFYSNREKFVIENKISSPFFEVNYVLDWWTEGHYGLTRTKFYISLEKLDYLIRNVEVGTQLHLGPELYSALREVRKGVMYILTHDRIHEKAG